jgi:hypothetical protein
MEDGASMYHTVPAMRSQPVQLPKIGPKTLGARQMAELSARLAVPKAVLTDLSFGEEMCHETINRHRKKDLDWERLDLLASPAKRASNCSAWKCDKPDPLLNTGTAFNTGISGDMGESSGTKLSSRRNMQETGSSFKSKEEDREEYRTRVENLVDRLAAPKVARMEPKPSGEIVLGQAAEASSHKKIDVHMLSARLASPKVQSGGSCPAGEKMILEAMEKSKRRTVDRNRILFLAVPTKRGATCHSWRQPMKESDQDWKKSDGYAALE